MYGSGINQQVVCATHGFDEASTGTKLYYYPHHKLLEPPESILRMVFPRVLDVSSDPASPQVLDIVDSVQWVQDHLVTPPRHRSSLLVRSTLHTSSYTSTT